MAATGAYVAQPPPKPEDPGGRGADFGKASPVAFVVLILFFVAVVFLARSMTKHLKKVPASFDPPEDKPDGVTQDRDKPVDDEKKSD
nr:hypothetical protein [Herbihabitans rhizosphaerae]